MRHLILSLYREEIVIGMFSLCSLVPHPWHNDLIAIESKKVSSPKSAIKFSTINHILKVSKLTRCHCRPMTRRVLETKIGTMVILERLISHEVSGISSRPRASDQTWIRLKHSSALCLKNTIRPKTTSCPWKPKYTKNNALVYSYTDRPWNVRSHVCIETPLRCSYIFACV